jgi:hypothetical protein
MTGTLSSNLPLKFSLPLLFATDRVIVHFDAALQFRELHRHGCRLARIAGVPDEYLHVAARI